MITFDLPFKLVCATNSRSHWRVVVKLKKEQRSFAEIVAISAINLHDRKHGALPAPYTILIERLGKRKMDSDNIATSAKYVRDGIADALGIDDGDESQVEWKYGQIIGKTYGCKVTISQRSAV